MAARSFSGLLPKGASNIIIFKSNNRHVGRQLQALTVRQLHSSSSCCSTAAPQLKTKRGSNLPDDVLPELEHEKKFPNFDPPSDSSTARLVASQAPYMVATYSRPSPVFVRGEGCYLYDMENRRYLDFTAGIAVNALGHADEQLTTVIKKQADLLIHTSNLYHNPWTGELCKLLVERTRESGAMKDAAKAFVCNSGSEANEAAIKFARKVGKIVGGPEKYEVVSFERSFHGRTMGSLSATPNEKYQKPFGPMVPGFKYSKYNDVSCLEGLITDNTCGVIVEPIQGEGGVYEATEEFLVALRKRCDEVGAVLIYDEIQSGLGRTGNLWAHGAYSQSAHPDIMTTAKALGNGIPVGATLVTESVASKIVVGDHGTTFGGNPLASRIAHHMLSRLSDPKLLSEVERKGAVLKSHLSALQEAFPKLITEVRGRGLILGLQLTEDPAPIVKMAREMGLLIITAGKDTLRFLPPMVITDEELASGVKILREAVKSHVDGQ